MLQVPDYAMIGEILLYSFGYLDGRNLARKLVQTYRLCSEQVGTAILPQKSSFTCNNQRLCAAQQPRSL